MKTHLKSKHQIDVNLATSVIRTTADDTIEALYNKLLLQLGHSKDELDHEIFRRSVNQQVVDQTLLDLFIIRRLSFSCVEWPEWHAFIRALNPQGHIFIPTSHNTVKARLDISFQQSKDVVRKRLQSSQSSIHLAVDLWTSPSHDLLLAVCASFVDVQDRYRNILIALRTTTGHSGEIQWETLQPVLEDFGILEKIGVVVGDNSGTNDTLCRTMARYLATEKKINWNQTFGRLRCMGHILNLVVQAFLFVNDE
jgi:hypothetical protein